MLLFTQQLLMKNITSFLVQNTKQINIYLNLLMKNKCLIKVSFGANNESFITSLLSVDEDKIVIDYGPKEDINNRLVNSSKITFETEYRGIKVSFVCSEVKKATYNNEMAFKMLTPSSIFWMERRDFFRVKPPFSNTSYCRLILDDRHPVDLRLYDISLTGFSVLNNSKELSTAIDLGKVFDKSSLMLSEIGETPIIFDIRNKNIINSDKLIKVQRVGCKFIALSKKSEDMIQSYMQQVQRELLIKDAH